VTKINNKKIPIILLVISMLYKVLVLPQDDYDLTGFLNAFIDGIIAAAIAIGLHSSGKTLLLAICQDNSIVSALFNSSSSDDDDDEEDEETEDEVDE
jgi:hypothetical protein